ncbi:MAG: phosphoadenylyl-sulfate reductase [Phycisphaerae bacterium]|nr:phosphoadenylyl-sulfate reductase [Phycisphaerae bacterium]
MAQAEQASSAATGLQQELAEAAERLESAPPQDILRWFVDRFGPEVSLACSFGMQSVAMLDMLDRINLAKTIEVFYLDTGVLFPETHQTRLRVQERYGFRAHRVAPELSWEDQQAKFDGHLYERGPAGVEQCCRIRKVEPLRQYLVDRAAWITGLRRGHGHTRQDVPVVLYDAVNQMPKANPLAATDDAAIWGYIKAHDVPFNPLYDQGYPSIGCNTPVCTRPVAEGEDGRAGRWSGMSKTECGIHLDGNAIQSLDSSQL